MNRLWIAVLVVLAACTGQQKNEVLVQNVGFAQGSTYNIQYMIPDEVDYQWQVDSILAEIDSSLSTYLDYSLITQINQGDTNVFLDEHFVKVFKAFQTVAESTNGKFDCTLAPVINAWGFGFTEKTKIDSSTILSLLKKVGYKKISMKGDSLLHNPSLLQLDFNALAQGYTVDVIAAFLTGRGIKNYMVEVGGELKARGRNANGKIWRIGIEKPSPEIDEYNRFETVVELPNKALATSGSYRKFYMQNGEKYAHTIDPHTGYPVKHKLLSVTVVTENTMLADAYATAFMVMGVPKTKNYLKKHSSLDAYLIYTNRKGEWETWATPGFSELQVN